MVLFAQYKKSIRKFKHLVLWWTQAACRWIENSYITIVVGGTLNLTLTARSSEMTGHELPQKQRRGA